MNKRFGPRRVRKSVGTRFRPTRPIGPVERGTRVGTRTSALTGPLGPASPADWPTDAGSIADDSRVGTRHPCSKSPENVGRAWCFGSSVRPRTAEPGRARWANSRYWLRWALDWREDPLGRGHQRGRTSSGWEPGSLRRAGRSGPRARRCIRAEFRRVMRSASLAGVGSRDELKSSQPRRSPLPVRENGRFWFRR